MKKVPTWNYKFLKPLARFLLKIIYQPKIINKQVIPNEGPIILAGNHKAYPDPVLVGISTKRVIHFFIKDVYTNSPLGPFFRSCGVLPVHVGKLHKDSFASAIELLEDGKSIGIFPEGTRNKTEKLLLPLQKGTVRIAKKTNAKIVPFAITGKYRPFGELTIEFGDPIDVSNMEVIEANTVLTEKITELLLKKKK